MKIKKEVNDFIVEEILDTSFEIKKEGEFKLFLLEKISLETLFVINKLSIDNSIPIKEIGYAGIKDKYPITKQYITIPKKYIFKKEKFDKFKLIFIGFVEKPLKTGNLIGNRFILKIRDLDSNDLKKFEKNSINIEKNGYINYYD